ncbi:hypothetical protein [Streptomyces sp. NPDC003032]
MSTETSTETRWDTEPWQAATASATAQSRGAGKHRGPVAEHDEATAPRGRHRKQASNS